MKILPWNSGALERPVAIELPSVPQPIKPTLIFIKFPPQKQTVSLKIDTRKQVKPQEIYY
jgi:hypothetical protein